MLLMSGMAAAQENAPEIAQKDSAPTFQSKVNLVLVPVVVRDGRGHAIARLTKDDFQLSDKGKVQTISSFSVVKHGASAQPQPAPPAPAETTEGAAPSASPQPISPKRYVAYLFDDLSIATADLMNLKKAAAAHIAKGLQASDRAAVYSFSGQTALDFTDDTAKLEEAVAKVRLQPIFQHVGRRCPILAITGPT